MSIRFLRLFSISCACLALGFLCWTLLILFGPEPATDGRPSGAGSLSEDLSLPVPFPNPDVQFSNALDRPLFAASRRPFSAPAESINSVIAVPQAVVAQPPEPAELKLLGIAIGERRAAALLATTENPTGEWIDVGGSISGWKVDEIERNAIFLSIGDARRQLRLYPEADSE